jgi:hypothetical protein
MEKHAFFWVSNLKISENGLKMAPPIEKKKIEFFFSIFSIFLEEPPEYGGSN